jgi:LuxR family transcriptional regulator, maltose regulon positive regulatory protein
MPTGDMSTAEAGPVSGRMRWVSRAGERGLVQRDALFERLSAASPGGVVLVCAPAGSGKSVLVRSWTEARGWRNRTAWVSVERGERDAQRFWLSLIDAVALVVESVERVAPTPGFRGEIAVDRLLADLDALEEPLTLVIDDLHELRSGEALAWLELFLSRVPPQVLVVLVTRDDPRLGLHRLRLSGELIELRGPDLAFSLEETCEFLAASGVSLSEADIALIQDRTEGWAAGLRLAAISLAAHPHPEQFLREFSGSERTVAGYLLTEVLERQPAEVRDLLLRTSILERVSPALADFLTGSPGAERILQELEDANAFVTSVDVGRRWFRYHHLFADLLQLELRRTAPTIVPSLHRAAAQWLEREGHVVAAIRHAEAARDYSTASRLLADNQMDLVLGGRADTISDLLKAFPEEVAASDAELAIVFATARLVDQELGQSKSYLELAQRLSDRVAPERTWHFELLFATVSLVVARWRGDLDTVLHSMRSVEASLEALPAGERALTHDFRSVAFENLGIAELWCSRFDDARRHLEQARALARRAGRPWLEIADLGHLAVAGPWTGLSFPEGLSLSEEAVRLADGYGWAEDPALLTALAAGAIALLWLGRLGDVEAWLERAERALRPDGEPASELVFHAARGLLYLTRIRFQEALTAFRAAERMQSLLATRHAFALPVHARLVQTQAYMGDLASARAALFQVGEEERDTAVMRAAAAEIHLAEGDPEQAVEVLAPLVDRDAQAVRPQWAIIEPLLLGAAARDQLGDRAGAETSLERALDLAETDGIILPFVLAPVGDVLERLPRHRTRHHTLLRTILDVRAGSSARPRGAPAPLREELSDAELRVVRYLPSNLKAPEIAAELCVSANTVRTHIRHIYAKLDAHDRNHAVVRARELGLLGPSR